MEVFPLLSFMLVAMVGLSLACAPPETRDAQSLQERAKVPDYIIYGTVISDKMKTKTNRPIEEEYEVRFEPICWLKRGPKPDAPSVGDNTMGENRGESGNATDADRATHNSTNQDDGLRNITVKEDRQYDCVSNDLKMGQEYILFLRYGGGIYSVDEVNEESGVVGPGPSDEDFGAVYRGIGAGMQGRPGAECQQGVAIPCFTGEDDLDVCSKGVAQGVGVWALALAGVIALAATF